MAEEIIIYNSKNSPIKSVMNDPTTYFGSVDNQKNLWDAAEKAELMAARRMGLVKHLLNSQTSNSDYSNIGLPTNQAVGARGLYYARRSWLQDIYLIYHSESVIKAMVEHIRNETFRKGFSEWQPKFKRKCPQCGMEYQKASEHCEQCVDDLGFPVKTRKPDERQKEAFDKWAARADKYGNPLIKILKEAHQDSLIADDTFIWLNKEYTWGFDHVAQEWVLKTKLKEIRRLDPQIIEYDLDEKYRPLMTHWLCPLNRTHLFQEPVPHCPECAANDPDLPAPPVFPTLYKYTYESEPIYFFEDEIIHYSIFEPSTLYGYPPLLTVYEKELTLVGMDRWLYRYFYERKTPPGVILINTDDPDSLRAISDKMRHDMQNDPPNFVPILGVNNKTGRGAVNFVRFFHTLQEMEYAPIREKIQQDLGMLYGVSPIWQNVVEGVGGISGQSQQIEVMNRVVEVDQEILNTQVMPYILESFGITDWVKKVRSPGQKTEDSQLDLQLKQTSVAQAIVGLGFKVKKMELNNGDLVFEFEEKPSQQDQNGQGGDASNGPSPAGGGGAMQAPINEEPAPKRDYYQDSQKNMETENNMQNESGESDQDLERSLQNLNLSSDQFDRLKDIIARGDLFLSKRDVEIPAGYHQHSGVMRPHPSNEWHRDPNVRAAGGHSYQMNQSSEQESNQSTQKSDKPTGNEQPMIQKPIAWTKENVAMRIDPNRMGVDEDAYNLNNCQIVQLTDGTKLWYKWAHDDDRVNQKLGYMAEYHYSRIAKAAGWDLVPEVRIVDLGNGTGSAMRWIPGVNEPAKLDETVVNSTVKRNRKLRKDYVRMKALDFITSCVDRHDGNWVYDQKGNIYTIDNESSYFGLQTNDSNELALLNLPRTMLTINKFTGRDIIGKGIQPEDYLDVMDEILKNKVNIISYVKSVPEVAVGNNILWQDYHWIEEKIDNALDILSNNAKQLVEYYAKKDM